MGRRVGLGLQEVFMLAQKRTNLDPDKTHTHSHFQHVLRIPHFEFVVIFTEIVRTFLR